MPFDINPQGSISLNPLVEYEAATIADAGCALRLVLANPGEQPETASKVVQLVMTAEQADGLAQVLLQMAERIRHARSTERRN